MRNKSLQLSLVLGLVCLLMNALAFATIRPRSGVKWCEAYLRLIRTQPKAFTYSRALQPLVSRIRMNRAALARGDLTQEAALATGGLAVSGTRSIPVLMTKFSNSGTDPYPVNNLQTELFDGPWPTGTMTQYYEEISYGQFSVTGTVSDWKTAAQNDSFYEGASDCNGLCGGTNNTGALIKEALDLNDNSINFAQYDNDGPDGVPNSGDDDGFVDFVAFIHPESGGECGGNNNVWSHRSTYSGWKGSDYTTNDAKSGGGFIRIDDYVIMPALACDNSTMIQIGVFAHEFGHAFGLPDLYDTDDDNGDSEGIGNWGLMAGGSWGGDGASPETPSHMSAWSKEFLGWINPTVVGGDQTPATIKNVEENDKSYKIAVDSNEYYLVSNRQKKGFDANLPQSGLLIWHINQAVVNAGLPNNRVNSDENSKGVDLEEADGNNDLDNTTNRGDAGDIFPGSSDKRKFDKTTSPSSSGSVAVCEISNSADSMTANLHVTTNTCPDDGDDDDNCSSLLLPRAPRAGKQTLLLWCLLLLPVVVAGWMAGRPRLGQHTARGKR